MANWTNEEVLLLGFGGWEDEPLPDVDKQIDGEQALFNLIIILHSRLTSDRLEKKPCKLKLQSHIFNM